MGIMVGSNFPRALAQDLYEWYFEAYDAEETVYDKIIEVIPMDSGDGIKGTEVIGVSKLKEVPDGQEIPLTEPLEGWTWYIKFKTYKDQIAVTDDMLSDLMGGKISGDLMEFARGWGEGVRITEEEAVARLFNAGTLTAGDKPAFDGSFTGEDDPHPAHIYDGKPFFAPSGSGHPFKLDASSVLGNLTESLNLDYSNIQTVYTAMSVANAKNERGDNIRIEPNVIVTNPNNRFVLDQILKSDYEIDNYGNKNVIGNLFVPVYWRYLEDTDAWFMGVAKRGIRFYDRMPPKITVYRDEKTDTWFAKVKRRFGVGVVQWRYWYGCNQAAS
ncbi:MAG: hypothetical protein JW885_11470 [Deltaproteobacteria bacterium]|nr:hypothetical protein [Candidatus Zymogenaceae bacterium]